MPIYEYRCKKCKHQFELIQKFSDRPIRKCPECGARSVEKLISRGAFQFKGTGWYVTDYARKGKSDDTAKPSKSKETTDGAGSTEAGGSARSSGSEKSPTAAPSTSTGKRGKGKGKGG